MEHQKKSQIYGQVFIYILSLFLVSFILVYGYKAIANFKNEQEKISCLKFNNDLKNAIQSISGDFGSVKIKNFQLCSLYTQVCFVEDFETPVIPAKTDPIIKDSIASNTGMNVFLVEDIAKDSFYAGKISVEPDVLCIRAVEGKVNLRLEGEGNHVAISQST